MIAVRVFIRSDSVDGCSVHSDKKKRWFHGVL
jgi:hypothetical protein